MLGAGFAASCLLQPQSYLRWEDERQWEGGASRTGPVHRTSYPTTKTKANETTLRTQDIHRDLRWQEIMHGKRLGRPLHPRNTRMVRCPPMSTGKLWDR